MPVGKFNPALKTETLKPGGTTMSSPLPGLKETSSPGHSAFPTGAAVTKAGSMRRSTNANTKLGARGLLTRIDQRPLSPPREGHAPVKDDVSPRALGLARQRVGYESAR